MRVPDVTFRGRVRGWPVAPDVDMVLLILMGFDLVWRGRPGNAGMDGGRFAALLIGRRLDGPGASDSASK